MMLMMLATSNAKTSSDGKGGSGDKKSDDSKGGDKKDDGEKKEILKLGQCDKDTVLPKYDLGKMKGVRVKADASFISLGLKEDVKLVRSGDKAATLIGDLTVRGKLKVNCEDIGDKFETVIQTFNKQIADLRTEVFTLRQALKKLSDDIPKTPSNCKHALQMGMKESKVYTFKDGSSAYCDQKTEGGGWTLLASFVNTDGISWTRPKSYNAWVDTSTFGSPSTATSKDYKSKDFNSLKINDIMLKDAYGYVGFKDVIGVKSMRDKMKSYKKCSVSAEVNPGSPKTFSNQANFKSNAILVFFGGDPNSHNNCAFSGSHSDSATLAVSGAGCGMMGAGQWGTNYNKGMDWHLKIHHGSSCLGCDTCKKWHGLNSVTSKQHNNNRGVHDESKYGLLFGR